MKLNELLTDIDVHSVAGDPSVDVSGVRYDSRQVEPGSVFVAVRGEETDGNRFVPEAIARGAVAIVSEHPPAGSLTWIQVPSDRGALAAMASRFYHRPTSELTLIGITGTNGKTTTAHLVESILEAHGESVALVGTTGHRGPGLASPSERTTPEAQDLEAFFRAAVDAGCRSAVMEVSSHAIAMHRVDALDFDVVALTNLSREHLDFHHTFGEYMETKRRLFTGLGAGPPESAVINKDDAFFSEFRAAGNARVWTFGMGSDADVHPTATELDGDGVRADMETPAGKISLKSPLLGAPNLYNIAAAIGIGLALQVPPDEIAEGIQRVRRVPGRLESIDCGQPFRVIVDYAHTDDALAKALDAVRQITPGRLIVVFGAGGNRDRDKRERMGATAARRSDHIIITSDNPRDEDPRAIMNAIQKGVQSVGGVSESIQDRRDAMARAIQCARPGDCVVIAGKGHESYQIIGPHRRPFDDRQVARELLRDR